MPLSGDETSGSWFCFPPHPMMLAKLLAGVSNTEAVLSVKKGTKSVPFAEYLRQDSTVCGKLLEGRDRWC